MILYIAGVLFIDLVAKYNTNGYADEYREKFDAFKPKIKGFKETDGKYSVGDIIEFFGGYHEDIRYSTEILGFDSDGGIYLLWDCYWFPIRDEEIRAIELKTKKQLEK